MTIYNKTIWRQADSRWGSLPYPTKAYSFAHNGCGCCAVTHCAIELENFKNYTPADVRKYMVQFATKGHGTLWNGITKGLENYGFNVHWRQADTMADIWKVLEKSLKKGVILFGSSKGGTKKITWTTGGHYVAFVDWKYENGDYWFYCKDSGGRKHDGWFSYRQHMAGDVRNVWICTSLKSGYKFIGSSTTPTPTPSTPTTTITKYATYSGAFPTKTIKKGSKGTNVTRWQNYLKWMGYDLKADGKFGGITRTKTIAAQKKLGFTGKAVDGIVGKNTIARAKAYKKAYKVVVAVTPTPTPQAPTSTPSTTSDDLPKKCIDVSYWQGKISQANWEKIKKSCGYAICRASYTSQSKFSLGADSTFATNFTNAKAAGLRVGAYHYSQAISVDEAKKEAEFLCNILKNYTPTFYVVCDFEYGGRLNSKIGKKASDIANAFCDVVKAHGYQPCIYANTSTLNNALTNPKYPVWVAQYNSTCTYKGAKVMWQYTSSGRVDGISASSTNSKSANVDLSHVYEVYPIQSEVTPTLGIATPIKSKYTGALPSLHVVKNASQVISDALKWGEWIVGNNTYHYGEYGNSAYIKKESKYYDNGKYKSIYNVTHSCGCHFCDTNYSRKVKKANKLGYKGENWEHTYVCNTFATAMYAHGGLEDIALERCTKSKAIGFNDKGKAPLLDKSANWKNMGKLAIKDLKAGDVLVSTKHMQCVYAPISSKKVKIIESTSYIGKYGSAASNNSIRIKEKTPSYVTVYRFVGKVDKDIAIRCGEYSDRVKLWQQFLNWAGFDCGTIDGKFGDKTKASTQAYQKQYGLTVDGIVGNQSLAMAKTIEK